MGVAFAGCAQGEPATVEEDAATADAGSSGDIDVAPAMDAGSPADLAPDVDASPNDLPATMDAAAPRDVSVAVDRPAVVDVPPARDVSAPTDAPAAPSVSDYLIQDVCVATDGSLLADDPWDGCPAGAVARDLRVGEPLPYHRHDQPGPGAPRGYQRKDSFPRAEGRAVHSFDFAPFGEFNPDRDGYDVSESDGDFVSIIGTRDPTGLAQTFYGSGCRLDDAWLLLPTAGFTAAGSRVATLALVGWERASRAFPGPCPSRYDSAYTDWAPRRFTFGGVNGAPAKALDAIVVNHYGGRDAATADHIERFYFTRAYGLTRWERWENNRGTARQEGCVGATAEGPFRRVDCRDWTQVFAEPLPYPSGAWPTPYARSNLLRNHDFGAGTVDAWARIGASTSGAMTNWSVIDDSDGGHHLATNCAGACSPGQGLYQDVPRGDLSGAYRFGARLWAEGEGDVEVVVFQRDSAARIVQRDAVTARLTRSQQRVRSPSFTVAAGVTQLRFTVYLNTSATVHVDDAWVAP